VRGKVEDDLAALRGSQRDARLEQIRLDELDPPRIDVPRDVLQQAGAQVVDDADVRTGLDQRVDEVRTDEGRTPRHQDLPPAPVLVHDLLPTRGSIRRSVSAARAPRIRDSSGARAARAAPCDDSAARPATARTDGRAKRCDRSRRPPRARARPTAPASRAWWPARERSAPPGPGRAGTREGRASRNTTPGPADTRSPAPAPPRPASARTA